MITRFTTHIRLSVATDPELFWHRTTPRSKRASACPKPNGTSAIVTDALAGIHAWWAGSRLARTMTSAHSRWRALGEPLCGWSCPGRLPRSTTPAVLLMCMATTKWTSTLTTVTCSAPQWTSTNTVMSSTVMTPLLMTRTQTRELPTPSTVLLVY
jgi:hypothetical protein